MLPCWHDVQPAEETATVKSSSSVVCRQHLMICWNGGGSRLHIPEIGCTGKISSGCASNKCSARTRFFSVAGLVINAKWSSLAPSRANKIIFVHENDRFVAALEKTTKLGYSSILYPCLYWCVELELVGCRLDLCYDGARLAVVWIMKLQFCRLPKQSKNRIVN